MSVTTAAAIAIRGVQAGDVIGATSTLPAFIRSNSAIEWMTDAGAVTRPGLTAGAAGRAPGRAA